MSQAFENLITLLIVLLLAIWIYSEMKRQSIIETLKGIKDGIVELGEDKIKK